MVDHLSKEMRSWNMSRVGNRDTTPEKAVRSVLHRMGYRFSVQRLNMPGRPDIVLPKYNAVIFVHGCFWHQHKGCKKYGVPKSNKSYWRKKFERTVARDKKNRALLKADGWRVIVVWECEIKNLSIIKKRFAKELHKQQFYEPLEGKK